MDFGALPPEINSGRMYVGPGAGLLLAAAAAWDGLGADLDATATSYQSVVSSMAGESWLGPASGSMAAAAAPYVGWMRATAAQCEQVADQAAAAAAAYEAAFAMTVPPPLIAANRVQLASLIATNILGQNTPAIAATEAHYGEMWAQDATAMYGYAANSAAATALAPFASPPQTTNPAGLVAQASAAAQNAGSAVGVRAQTALSNAMSAVPQALQSLAAPGSSALGFPGMAMGQGASAVSSAAYSPMSALSSLGNAPGKGVAKSAGAVTAGASGLQALSTFFDSPAGVALGIGSGMGSDVGGVGFDVAGLGMDFFGTGLDLTGVGTLTGTGVGPLEGTTLLGGLGGGEGLAHLGGFGGVGASASMGQSASLGGALSVPQTWAEALEAGPINPIAPMSLPAANLAAAPPVMSSGLSMPKLSMPSFIGREADGAVQRIVLRPSVIPHSPLAG